MDGKWGAKKRKLDTNEMMSGGRFYALSLH